MSEQNVEGPVLRGGLPVREDQRLVTGLRLFLEHRAPFTVLLGTQFAFGEVVKLKKNL